jgi:biotin carboxyl carrier protein
VLGGDEADVLAVLDGHGVHPANRNGAGQIVAAGAVDALERLVAAPPAGAKIRKLEVAGAFHTPYMGPAEAALAAVAAGITPTDPARILLSNLDGTAVGHGREMVQRLVRQVTAPVRWDLCTHTLAALGVTGIIELPPAGTLAGLLKRELKKTGVPEIVTLKTPDDLPAARDLIARHGTPPGRRPAATFRVVVSPSPGSFAPSADLAVGETVRSGQAIGQVLTRQGPVEVTAHGDGLLTEWLAHHDDPVAPGQPLARIGGAH